MSEESSFINDFSCRPLDAERAHSALYKLLRLSPPDARYGEALEYLVQSHALQPKHSAATIRQWSHAQLGDACRHWLYSSNTVATEVDEWLTALWVWEELQQCQTAPWLQAISHRFISNTALHHKAPHTAAGLPAEKEHVTPEALKNWLQRMGVDSPSVFSPNTLFEPNTLVEASQQALLSVYCQHPFPWTALLKAVSASSLACHPSVQRLQAQYQQLLSQQNAPCWSASAFQSPLGGQQLGAQQIDRLQQLSSLQLSSPAKQFTHPQPELSQQHGSSQPNTEDVTISLKASRCRPLRGVLLVEGTSEVVLLPAIATALGISLSQHGIQLVAVGGKSLMMKHYHQLASFVACPITALLDADGAEEQRQLTLAMRTPPQTSESNSENSNESNHDCAVILPEGTLEDSLSDALIADTLNRYYQPEAFSALGIALRRSNAPPHNRTLTALERVFKEWELASPRKGSHKEKHFDKVDFAYHVAQTLLKNVSNGLYKNTSPVSAPDSAIVSAPVSSSLSNFLHHVVRLSTLG